MASAESTFKILKRGMDAADRGETLAAQIHLETAFNQGRSPLACSYLGFCKAREDGTFKEALKLCGEALSREPSNALHYYNLGRIYRTMGRKPEAIDAFFTGLKMQRHPLILTQLRELGVRRPPIFRWLERGHPLNRIVGKAVGWMRPAPGV